MSINGVEIVINCTNESFFNRDYGAGPEIARMLRAIAHMYEAGQMEIGIKQLYDKKGEKVGYVETAGEE